MPRGRKKSTDFDHSKAVRITFRLDENTAATFRTIAAIKRMKLEELGREAIRDSIKKSKTSLKDFKVDL